MSAKRILASLALFARIVLVFQGGMSHAHTRAPLAVTAVVKAASFSGDSVSLGEGVAILGLRLAATVGPVFIDGICAILHFGLDSWRR